MPFAISHGKVEEKIAEKNEQQQQESSNAKIWNEIVKNYEMIQGAQLSNSFILLMVLNEAKQPLTTTKISELISKRSKGEIYKISATLRDSLELRLKREGYVEGIDKKNKGLYSITPKGQKLLQGWIVFCQLITLKFIFIISFITIYPSFHNFDLHFFNEKSSINYTAQHSTSAYKVKGKIINIWLYKQIGLVS